MRKVLTVSNLSKYYGSFLALSDLSFHVEEGSVFGLLGPNGSGKTTTLGILLGILPSSKGAFEWFESSNDSAQRKRIGALVETPNFYDYLSGEKNLKIAAEIKGVPASDIDRVLQFVRLHDRKKHPFNAYSLGMKQRLAIASALLGEPEVLVLDEPTNGLDPQGISEIRELIQRVSANGSTIIIASHMLDEVEKVCTDVAIIKKGKLLVQGKVDSILKDEKQVIVRSSDLDILEKILSENPNIIKVVRKSDALQLKVADDFSNEEINRLAADRGVFLSHLSSQKKNLETQFLEITAGK